MFTNTEFNYTHIINKDQDISFQSKQTTSKQNGIDVADLFNWISHFQIKQTVPKLRNLCFYTNNETEI